MVAPRARPGATEANTPIKPIATTRDRLLGYQRIRCIGDMGSPSKRAAKAERTTWTHPILRFQNRGHSGAGGSSTRIPHCNADGTSTRVRDAAWPFASLEAVARYRRCHFQNG